MNIISTFLVTFLMLLLSACGGSGGGSTNTPSPTPNPEPSPVYEFSEPVLNSVVFHQFSFANDIKLAATDSGVYQLTNNQWRAISPSSWYVYDLAIISSTHYIASIKLNNDYSLFESNDSGATWENINNNFGNTRSNNGGANERMNRIKYDAASGVLYATGYDVLASSSDFAQTWLAEAGTWQGLARGLAALAIHPMRTQIWFGGQGAIENPIFREYNLSNGVLTVHDDAIAALLPLPSTIEGIVFHPSNNSTIFAMGEGGIVRTNDAGASWQGLLLDDNYRFYYDLVIDPNNTNRIYTAGWSKDINTAQALIVERSLDAGANWELYTHPNTSLFGGVRSMAHSVHQDNKLTLYLGLQNGGLVEVTFND